MTRDQTCQFPGCRVPAHRCDIDHGIPHDPDNGTGPTSETNLGPLATATADRSGTTGHPPNTRSRGAPTLPAVFERCIRVLDTQVVMDANNALFKILSTS